MLWWRVHPSEGFIFNSRCQEQLLLSSFLLKRKELFLNVISNPVWYLREQEKKSSFVVFTVQKHFFAIDFELNGVCVWIKVIWIAEFLLEHHYWGWICYTGPVISRMTTSIAGSVVDFLCYTNTPKHNGIALLNWWMAKFTWVNVSPFDLPHCF